MPLRSLTTWDGHWVLEVDDNLIMDGQDLAASLGYDAAYGFSLIRGLPFYFFEQQGKVRISYSGQTLPNAYDQVFHNQCCERAIHNVAALGDTVLFHALWNGTWYLVEAGVYDGEMAGTYRYTAPEGWSFHHPTYWDRLDEELGFVQDTTTGKTVAFASLSTTQAELERWLESEIDRKLAATEAENILAEPLTTEQKGDVTIYRYAILSRLETTETLLHTTVFFDGQRRYEFYAAIPPLAEEEYEAIVGSFRLAAAFSGQPGTAINRITIEGVQVTAGEQIVVHGQSTLPDGTCLGSELWADGELQAWWPSVICVPVHKGAWEMNVRLGSGEVPAVLDPSAQYMLRVYQQNGPDIVSVFAFDLAGPPTAEP
jgi:hypothetical protein